MKKRRNMAAAILLASMMAVSTCVATTAITASASSIKVNEDADTNNEYKAYQILRGTPDANGNLSNVAFGDALDLTEGKLPANLVAALITSNGTVFSTLTVDTTPTAFADMIAHLGTNNSPDVQEFAKVIGKYVKSAAGTAVETTPTTVADGYYVVKEEGTGSPRTLNLLKVVNAENVTVTVKEDKPKSDKTVADANDSKTLAETNTKTADYDIGDDVPYTLTFKLPSDYANYEKYPVTFWDDMGSGLTLNPDSVKIWYGDTDTSTGGTPITLVEATGGGFTHPTGGTLYKYEIANLKELSEAAGLTGGKTITIKYTAKLNDTAVIGGEGNPNVYKVSYANDPNWTATPGPNETTPPPAPPTEDTPETKNVVFTYKFIVNKVDDDGNPLFGAHFALYKWTDKDNTAAVNATTGWTQVVEITTDTAEFNFKGLDDGIYKLVETKTPSAEYNEIAPVMFEITATHNDDYYSFTLDTDLTDASPNASTGEITVNITNNKGMTLPSTGGIGTTIFYVVGGTLVLGAVVLLITKKRMSVDDEK